MTRRFIDAENNLVYEVDEEAFLREWEANGNRLPYLNGRDHRWNVVGLMILFAVMFCWGALAATIFWTVTG